ncbi:MAG: sigma-70 family RNA polymerase sigma factor [Bacteroidota bacterium]
MPIFKAHIRRLTDEELISRYQASKDTYLVGILFERYTELVFMACMKYLKNEAESEDASMQIFEKLIKDLRVYQIENFRHWIRTVVRNHCFAILRQRKKKLETIQELRKGPEIVDTVFYMRPEHEEREWELIQLEKAVAELKEDQRKCVELFFLEKKSYKEIVLATGYSLKQVKSHIQNGKRNLKNSLNQMFYEG